MKISRRIESLVNDGLVDEVIRPLKSGKKADVFVVRSGDGSSCFQRRTFFILSGVNQSQVDLFLGRLALDRPIPSSAILNSTHC